MAIPLTGGQENTWQVEQLTGDTAVALHRLIDEPVHASDVLMANHFTSTHPSSPFVGQLVAIRKHDASFVRLRGLARRVERPDGSAEEDLLPPAHAVAVLRDEIGDPCRTRTPRRSRQPWPAERAAGRGLAAFHAQAGLLAVGGEAIISGHACCADHPLRRPRGPRRRRRARPGPGDGEPLYEVSSAGSTTPTPASLRPERFMNAAAPAGLESSAGREDIRPER